NSRRKKSADRNIRDQVMPDRIQKGIVDNPFQFLFAETCGLLSRVVKDLRNRKVAFRLGGTEVIHPQDAAGGHCADLLINCKRLRYATGKVKAGASGRARA